MKPARGVETEDSQGPDVLFPALMEEDIGDHPLFRGDTEKCGKVELIEILRGVLLVALLTFRTPWIRLSFRNTML